MSGQEEFRERLREIRDAMSDEAADVSRARRLQREDESAVMDGLMAQYQRLVQMRGETVPHLGELLEALGQATGAQRTALLQEARRDLAAAERDKADVEERVEGLYRALEGIADEMAGGSLQRYRRDERGVLTITARIERAEGRI